ncbi:MAG: late competence development ComFB family protein [Synechococcus sp.]
MRSARDDSEAKMVNVLEELVLNEANRQISNLAEREQQKLVVVEVAAYVLNRMEPMYATTRDGWGHQRERALRNSSQEVRQQVTRAIAKMQKTPSLLRRPLPETVEARCALNQLRTTLNQPNLTWMEVPQLVQALMAQTQTMIHSHSKVG